MGKRDVRCEKDPPLPVEVFCPCVLVVISCSALGILGTVEAGTSLVSSFGGTRTVPVLGQGSLTLGIGRKGRSKLPSLALTRAGKIEIRLSPTSLPSLFPLSPLRTKAHFNPSLRREVSSES